MRVFRGDYMKIMAIHDEMMHRMSIKLLDEHQQKEVARTIQDNSIEFEDVGEILKVRVYSEFEKEAITEAASSTV